MGEKKKKKKRRIENGLANAAWKELGCTWDGIARARVAEVLCDTF
jgi:hypothetical protein